MQWFRIYNTLRDYLYNDDDDMDIQQIHLFNKSLRQLKYMFKYTDCLFLDFSYLTFSIRWVHSQCCIYICMHRTRGFNNSIDSKQVIVQERWTASEFEISHGIYSCALYTRLNKTAYVIRSLFTLNVIKHLLFSSFPPVILAEDSHPTSSYRCSDFVIIGKPVVTIQIASSCILSSLITYPIPQLSKISVAKNKMVLM